MRDSLTFVVFTFNEEKRLPWVIRNFTGYGRILVVDNHSSDRTVEIALQAGCEVLIHKNPGWVEDEGTAKRVLEEVKTPWIYWAFADEMVDAEGLRKLSECIESDQWDVIRMARKNYFYGRFCYDIIAAPQVKVFRKGSIDFTANKIHHFGQVTVDDSRVLQMDEKYYVHHFISHNATAYINSLNRYTDLEENVDTGLMNFLRCFFGATLLGTSRQYFFKKGYKGGRPAFYLILMTVLVYYWLRFIKSDERVNGVTIETTELKNDERRRQIAEGLSA